MKSQLKSFFAASVVLAVMATGCSGSRKNKTEAVDNEMQANGAEINICGQWYIENIVFNDSDYVRPDEAVPGSKQYIVFEDSTYFIMTNCNSLTGAYAIKGDSITLGDGAMTEMACDNMEIENALRRIIPQISTIEVQNDSVMRLNGTRPAECILLRKAMTEIK